MLAAVTEVIRGQGGKETETEYFAALVSAAFINTVQPLATSRVKTADRHVQQLSQALS